MTWRCPKCREKVDAELDTCWHCGTGQDGTVDPGFQHADVYEPPIPRPKPQFHLSSLITFTAASCLVFALWGSLLQGTAEPLTIFVGVAGLAFLMLQLCSWLVLLSTRRMQREIRQSVRQTEAEKRFPPYHWR